MQAEEYLMQIKELDCMINNKQVELKQLRELSKSISSQPTDQKCVQSSGTSDKVGNIVAKIVDMQHEINDMIDEYVDTKAEIIKTIEKIIPVDLKYYDLLFKRYVEYKGFTIISDEMGYSYQWVVELHPKALQEVNNLLKPI